MISVIYIYKRLTTFNARASVISCALTKTCSFVGYALPVPNGNRRSYGGITYHVGRRDSEEVGPCCDRHRLVPESGWRVSGFSNAARCIAIEINACRSNPHLWAFLLFTINSGVCPVVVCFPKIDYTCVKDPFVACLINIIWCDGIKGRVWNVHGKFHGKSRNGESKMERGYSFGCRTQWDAGTPTE